MHNIENRLGSNAPYLEQDISGNDNDIVVDNNNVDEVFDEEAIAVLQSLIQLFE